MRSSFTTVVSVRTTPFTCGSHASVTIRIRCEGAGGSIASRVVGLPRMTASGSCALRIAAWREERQAIDCGPVDQLESPIVMLHKRGAALHPVAIIEIEHALHLTHLRVVDVA